MEVSMMFKRILTSMMVLSLIFLPVMQDVTFADHTAEHAQEEAEKQAERDAALIRGVLFLVGAALLVYMFSATKASGLNSDNQGKYLGSSNQPIKVKLDWANFGVRPVTHSDSFTKSGNELRSPDLKIVYEW